jgi:hypothetical protein
MRWIIASTLVPLLAGCNIQDTPPQTQIDRLRVLSVRIDGPPDPASATGERFAELAPGDAATLTPLLLAPGIGSADGSAPVDDMTVDQDVCLEDYADLSWERSGSTCASGTAKAGVYRFWFWCPPQAATLFYDPCTNTDVLASPEQIFTSGAIQTLGSTCPPPAPGSLPTPTPTACVQPRSDLFQDPNLDPLVPRRGVLMSVLLVAVIDVDGDVAAGRLDQLVAKIQAKAIPAVVALKRVPVLGQPTNHNPVPTQILNASVPIESGDVLGSEGQLDVGYAGYPPNDPRESYVQVNPDGTETPRIEQLDTAWFSGFGRFDSIHTLFGETNVFTPATGNGIDQPPPGPAGSNYSMPFAIVVRDGRGGEGWAVRSVAAAP